MQINMSLAHANQEARRLYQGPRLLSKLYVEDPPFAEAWWLLNQQNRRENAEAPMRITAIRYYLWLADHAFLPLGSPVLFPSLFQFLSGEERRPDKGVIKVFLEQRWLSTQVWDDAQLIFAFTRDGQNLCSATNVG